MMPIESSILIIEDDDFYFDGLHRHFKARFEHVYRASDIKAAKDILSRQKFTMVIVDLGLPGPDRELPSVRMAVLRSVVSASPDTTIIVITGRFSSIEVDECRRLGISGYLSKTSLNSPKLATLMERLEHDDFILHAHADEHQEARAVSYPSLTFTEEECLQWVECRPVFMKRIELFKLMARHFKLKNPDVSEQRYKRARGKVISYLKGIQDDRRTKSDV